MEFCAGWEGPPVGLLQFKHTPCKAKLPTPFGLGLGAKRYAGK